MRSVLLLVGAGLLGLGCDDTAMPGAPDMSVVFDFAMTNDHDLAMGPDMATPPDMTTPQKLAGTAVLTDVESTIVVPMGDGGLQPLTVRAIAPLLTFGPAAAKHDFSNTTALGGCQGDHYDVGKGDVPPPDIDSGTVTFTGFGGGMLLDGTTAPSKISCARVSGFYKCGYGDLVAGMPTMPYVDVAPYPGNATPIADGQMITMAGSGAQFGPWTSTVPAKDQPMVTNPPDLSAATWDPTQDFMLGFSCPNGCGLSVVAVAITAADQPPQMFDPATSPTSGVLQCFGLAGGGTLKLNKEALQAAFGCDNTGNNCDPQLHSVRTVVVRFGLPVNVMTNDAAMSQVQTAAGRGVSGIAPR